MHTRTLQFRSSLVPRSPAQLLLLAERSGRRGKERGRVVRDGRGKGRSGGGMEGTGEERSGGGRERAGEEHKGKGVGKAW